MQNVSLNCMRISRLMGSYQACCKCRGTEDRLRWNVMFKFLRCQTEESSIQRFFFWACLRHENVWFEKLKSICFLFFLHRMHNFYIKETPIILFNSSTCYNLLLRVSLLSLWKMKIFLPHLCSVQSVVYSNKQQYVLHSSTPFSFFLYKNIPYRHFDARLSK